MKKIKEFLLRTVLNKRVVSACLTLAFLIGMFDGISLFTYAAQSGTYYGDTPESDGYYRWPLYIGYIAMPEDLMSHYELYAKYNQANMINAQNDVNGTHDYSNGYHTSDIVFAGRVDMIDKWKLKDFTIDLSFVDTRNYYQAFRERSFRMYLYWDVQHHGTSRYHYQTNRNALSYQRIGSFASLGNWATDNQGWTWFRSITVPITAKVKNITAVFAEVDNPYITGAELQMRENDTPLIWFNFTEELRPVDEDVLNKELLSEVFNVQLEMTPAIDPNGESMIVDATCVEFLSGYTNKGTGKGKLGFEILPEDWAALQATGKEWVIRNIIDKCTYGSYPIKYPYPLSDYCSPSYNQNVYYTAPLPIVDNVGNTFKLGNIKNINVRIDTVDPYVDNIFLTGDCLPASNTSGKDLTSWEDTTDLKWSDLFVGSSDSFYATVELNEQIQTLTDEEKSNIYLEWNVKDIYGTPLRTYLSKEQKAAYVNGSASISQLVFNPLPLYDVAPEETGKQIRPVKLHGGQYIEDLFNNSMTEVENDGGVYTLTLATDKQVYFDIQGPAVTLGNIIKGTDENVTTYSVELTISDKTSDEAGRFFAGMVGGDSNVMGSFSLYSNDDIPAIEYSYSLLPASETFTGIYANSGTLGSRTSQSPSPITVPSEGKYILYLKLNNTDNIEISDQTGAALDFTLWDILGNTSQQTQPLSGLQLDNVAPTASVSSETSVSVADTNSARFNATVTAQDVNGISKFEYKWGSEGVVNQETCNNNYKVTFSVPEKTVSGSGTVSDTLDIRVYDKYNNVTQLPTVNFSADLSKYIPQASYSGDPLTPSSVNDIIISAPLTTEDGSKVGGYIRVEYTDANGIIHRGQSVVGASESISLFGTNSLKWYDNSTGSFVESNGDFLTAIYGDAAFTIWAYEKEIEASQDAVASTEKAQSMTVSISRTSPRNDAHSVAFGNLTLSNGALSEIYGEYNSYRYYGFTPENFKDARYNFTIVNAIRPDWSTVDVDWDNSYAVLLKVNNDGSLSGTDAEVTARIPLSSGINQTMIVPAAGINGSKFETGVYVWKVCIAQKAGGSQEFIAPTRLLYDAVEPNAEFGVYSFTDEISLQIGEYGAFDADDPDAYDHTLDCLTFTQSNADGSPLKTIEVSAGVVYDGYSDNFEIIKDKNGKNSYAVIPTGGSGRINTLIEIDLGQFDGNTYMGRELGILKGIRYWNANAPVDLEALPFELDYQNDQYAYLTLYKDIEWYDPNNGRNIVVDDLSVLEPAKSHSDFRLTLGKNRIAYQLQLTNGEMSDVMYFDLILRTTIPTVNVEFEPGPGKDVTYTLDDGTVFEQRHTNSVTASVTGYNSVSGSLDFYQLTAGQYISGHDTYSYALRKVSDPNNIVLTRGSDPYNYPPQDNYGCPDVQDFFIAVDEYGNGVVILPFIGDENDAGNSQFDTLINPGLGKISSLNVTRAYDYNVDENGRYMLTINHTYSNESNNSIERVMDGYSVQLDDREPVYINAADNNADIVEGVNDAGIYRIDNVGRVFFSVPYNPNVELGAELGHTVTVRAYLNGEVTDEKVYRSAPIDMYNSYNVKPTVYAYGSSFGEVRIESYFDDGDKTDKRFGRPYILIDGAEDFNTYHFIRAYESGTVTVNFIDKFGDSYSQEVNLNLPSDPKVTISTTEPTVGPVVVTITSELYDLSVEKVHSYNDPNYEKIAVPDGTIVEGDGTKELKLTFYNNTFFDMENPDDSTSLFSYDNVTVYYSESDDSATNSIDIIVDNIYNEPIKPKIEWSYLEQDVIDTYVVDGVTYNNVVFGTVEAWVVDENEIPLIDPLTGTTPTFTFEPGGVTSYTFSGYTNIVGTAGEDITATLPVTLLEKVYSEIPNEETTPVADIWAPDVAINGASIYDGELQYVLAAYLNTTLRDETSPVSTIAGEWISDWSETYGSSMIFSDMNNLIGCFGWADSYRLDVNVLDESSTKVFVTAENNTAAPNYVGGTSDTIDGVKVIGRSVAVSQNCSFIIHVVDEAGNAVSVPVNVTALGAEAPVPSYSLALSKDGTEVRAYLIAPNVDGISNLQITDGTFAPDPSAKVEDDTESSFYGDQYLVYTTNGNKTLYYSYELNGRTVTGQLTFNIDKIDTTGISIVSGPKWSANYDPNATADNLEQLWIKMTNQDITAQFTFNKNISEAYFTDAQGNRITPAYATVAFLGTQATVSYSYNETALKLVCVSAANSNHTVSFDLPAIVSIDKSAPAIFDTAISYSENHRNALITLKLSEQVVFQGDGQYITEVEDDYLYYTKSQKVSENGDYKFAFVDRAGNRTEKSVTINGIVSDGITMHISTTANDSGIVDPSTLIPNVGDTVYIKTDRDAKITVDHTSSEISATANQWTAVQIVESLSGLYPIIRAFDAYGNSAVIQLDSVPLKDKNAPSMIMLRNLLSVSLESTDAEIEALLKGNIIVSDETTPADQLVYEFTYSRLMVGGTTSVTYKVTDSSGNSSSCVGQIRFYGANELVVKVNGEVVERDDTVVVSKDDINLEISSAGEPYKVMWKTGIKTVAQVKINAETLTSYTEEAKSYELGFDENGYYTVVITTQSQDTYRVILYVED
ncbi:MAG: hypothetical protein J6D42_02230 [Clostridia bacterium]|nr:hypothetical protein [Clostridia bacterium]